MFRILGEVNAEKQKANTTRRSPEKRKKIAMRVVQQPVSPAIVRRLMATKACACVVLFLLFPVFPFSGG